VAQVKPNWVVPAEAISRKGHVTTTFNVHKDGSMTDLTIVEPNPLDDAFKRAALSALTASNPLPPLPPAYPADQAFLTVTFFYNESAGPSAFDNRFLVPKQ
jgi:TonB family protein